MQEYFYYILESTNSIYQWQFVIFDSVVEEVSIFQTENNY